MNWKMNLGIRLGLAAGLTTWALARAALAADAPAPAAPAAAVAAEPSPTALTPPRLAKFVEAVYPEAARAAGQSAAVELELALDETGKVVTARVLEPAGNGFDEAALAAAQQFRFEPARRGETPIGAKIRYRYVFELAAAPAAPAQGALAGRVLLRQGGDEVLGAAVTLSSEDGSVTRTAATDGAGGFRFTELPPGRYRVKVAGTSLAPVDVREDVSAGELTSVTYRLESAVTRAPGGELEFGATATIEAPPGRSPSAR